MQPSRRSVVATLAAFSASSSCGQSPAPTAHARFLSCARKPDGSHAAVILSDAGDILVEIALPDRGHSSAISPGGDKAVSFARRPGAYMATFHLDDPETARVIPAPHDRTLYGHGVYSDDGRALYTSENAFDEARGVIGVYDVASGYKRIGELPSGGVGPHQLLMLRDGRTLAIANGGIETHPDFPRAKLNLSAMRSNLAYVDTVSGNLVDVVETPDHLQRLSLRHLTETSEGAIWVGGQYEGPVGDDISLIGVHHRGQPMRFADDRHTNPPLSDYVGSVATNGDGSKVALTSPRGGCIQIWDADSLKLAEQRAVSDICGVSPWESGFVTSDGSGRIWRNEQLIASHPGWSWDNHLVPLA